MGGEGWVGMDGRREIEERDRGRMKMREMEIEMKEV